MNLQAKTTNESKPVPIESLRFSGGVFEFRESPQESETETANSRAFRLVARTNAPVEHWFWGTCYHDLDGVTISRDRVPVDWLHRDDEIVGYAEDFEVVETGAGSRELVGTGELVPFLEDDRASEIIHRATSGIPYEASIDFGGSGIEIEELGAGVEAEVNGETVSGPAVIFRRWPLRGIAICPHGYDEKTKTEVFSGEKSEVSVTLLQGRGGMDENKQRENSDEIRKQFSEELKKFADRFGPKGAEYFAAGLDWAESLELHLDEKEKELAKTKAELEEVNEKLASLSFGEDSPVDLGVAPSDQKVGAGLSQFIRIHDSRK